MTFDTYLVRFAIRGIGPSKAHTCNEKHREKKGRRTCATQVRF